MQKLSESIAREVECFKVDLLDTKKQELNVKNPEHRRIINNIVANEKAYRRHIARAGCGAPPDEAKPEAPNSI